MYKGIPNSPEATLTSDINSTQTTITVSDANIIPEVPNILVIGGNTDNPETVKVTGKDGNTLTVERGFQGVPRSWNTGTVIARNFTEYDYNALKENIETLDAEQKLKMAKVEKEINDFRNTFNQMNINQEATQKVSGYGIISLPKNAANGQISVTLKGRTVNNLMGTDGDCEDTSKFTAMNCTLALDATNKVFGNNGIKITIATGQTQGIMSYNIFSKLNKAKYYLITAHLKKGNCTDLKLRLETDDVDIESSAVTATSFIRAGIVVQPSDIDTATSAVIQIIVNGAEGQYGYVDGIMVNEITSEEYALGAAVCMSRYNYHNSTKSTISACRIKSVGKNLVKNGNGEYGTKYWYLTYHTKDGIVNGNISYNGEEFIVSDGEFIYTCVTSDFIPVKYLQSYKIQMNKSRHQTLVRLYDKNKKRIYNSLGEFGDFEYNTNMRQYYKNYSYNNATILTINSPIVAYVRIGFLVQQQTHTFSNVIMTPINNETDTSNIIYEPYKKSLLYITAKDNDNKIVNLNSLNNGIADTIKQNEQGEFELWKYIGVKGNVANGTTIDYDDMADGGVFYAWNDDGETETGIKGDTLGIDATTLTYQLAEPIVTPIQVSGTLVSYPSGTVYIEPYVADAGIYTDKVEVLYSDLLIKALEKISKVDFDTGLETELDITEAVIAEDKLSFTHPDLVDGDIVFFTYEYDRESTEGETEIEYYDSRYVIKDSVTGKFYKWHIAVADGVPSIELTEV